MAIKSFGASITVATNLVGGLTAINNGGIEAEVIDVTNHDSPDNSREFIGGLLDGGEITMEGQYVFGDEGQDHLRDNIGATVAFVLSYSTGSKITGSGVVVTAGEGAPLEGAVPFNATIKVSGKPVRSAL